MKSEPSAASIAAVFASVLPSSIVDFMDEDPVLAAVPGSSTRVLTLGQLGSFDFADLCRVVRRVIESQQDVTIRSMDGAEVAVMVGPEGVIATGEGLSAELSTLEVLSDKKAQRLAALANVLRLVKPFAPELLALLEEAERRPLSDGEVAAVVEALTSSVRVRQAQIERRLRQDSASFSTFFPEALSYYEDFCGPDPKGRETDVYLTEDLPEARRALIRNDLAQGLRVAGIGCLTDHLAPGAWLNGFSDDEVWDSIAEIGLDRDPFSVIAKLDIAMYRLHDSRFATLAASAVDRLSNREFPSRTGHDVYQTLGLLFTIGKRALALMPAMAERPPYWRRMCGLMQAVVITHSLDDFSGAFDALCEELGRQVPTAGHFVNLLDFRREPFYQGGWESPVGLRTGILGLAAALEKRHADQGRQMPHYERLRGALADVGQDDQNLLLALPGPLPDPTKSSAYTAGEDDLRRAGIEDLAGYSLLQRIPTEILQLAAESLQKLGEVAGGEEEDRGQFMRTMMAGATLSAAARSEAVADAVSSTLLTKAESFEPVEVFVAVQVLIVANAARQDGTAWVWLEENLHRLAVAVPYGASSTALYQTLAELKRVLSVEQNVTSRAEAAASAGVA